MRVIVLLVLLVGWIPSVDAKKIAWLDARITRIQVSGASQLVTCDKGSEAGVGKEWTAKLVAGQREVADAKLVRFDKTSSVLKVDATFDQPPPDLACRLFPPAVSPKKP